MQAASGAAIFVSAGCVACHDGPRGMGRVLYDYADIGTDAEMMKWVDPDLDGMPNGGIYFEEGDGVTHPRGPVLPGRAAADDHGAGLRRSGPHLRLRPA